MLIFNTVALVKFPGQVLSRPNLDSIEHERLNHQISLRIKASHGLAYDYCQGIRDAITLSIQTHSSLIGGVTPSIQIEMSPLRKLQCQQFFACWEYFKRHPVDESNYLVDVRSLSFYAKCDNETIASVPAKATQLVFKQAGCHSIQLCHTAMQEAFDTCAQCR